MIKALRIARTLVVAACGLTAISAQAQSVVNGATYKITHKGAFDPATGTPLCLDVDFNLPDPGTRIRQFLDNGFDAQRFVLELQPDSTYKVRHKGTVMYLQTIGLADTNFAKTEQNVSSPANAQHWRLTDMGGGYFKFTMRGTNRCLEAAFNSNIPGSDVGIFDDNGNDAQRWKLDLIDMPTAVEGQFGAGFLLEAYPNPAPAQRDLHLYAQTTTAGMGSVEVADLTGRVLVTQPLLLQAGGQAVTVQGTSALAAGTYIIRLRQGALLRQMRLAVQ